MGGRRNVETDSLLEVNRAIAKYISQLREGIGKMRDAAIDCSDNMGSDAISQKNIEELEDCLKKLSATIPEAEDAMKVIQEMYNKTEELME